MTDTPDDPRALKLSDRFSAEALGMLAKIIVSRSTKDPATPNLAFVNDIPWTVADALADDGIRISPDSVQSVIDLVYSDMPETLYMIDPNFDPNQIPPAEEPNDKEGKWIDERMPELIADQKLAQLEAPFHQRIKDAIAGLYRAEMDMPEDTPADEVIKQIQNRIFAGIREELEDYRPGILADKTDTFWSVSGVGLSLIMREHADHAREEFKQYAMMFQNAPRLGGGKPGGTDL